MKISSLEHTDFDTLFRGFERAFSDYEIHFDKDEVRSMLLRRGYDPHLSFAAFDNGEIAAFTLNGIGQFNGIPTAYDTGTGTAPEYRGQGLAGEIFTHSLPFLRYAGIRQYLLEVLQTNQKAIAVYRRMKFEVTRELDCFRQTIDSIRTTINVNADCRIGPIDVSSIKEATSFRDFDPSWQNSIESIVRGESSLTCLGAFLDGELAAYCVFDPSTGDLTQIAVSPEHRHKGIASRLLHEAIPRFSTDFIKVLNVSADNSTLPSFLRSMNITPAASQFEMILPL